MTRGYNAEERRQIAAGTFFTAEELRRNPRLGGQAARTSQPGTRRDPNLAPPTAAARKMLAEMEDLPPLDFEAGLREAAAKRQAANAPVGKCRSCGEKITELGGDWTTDDGTTACYIPADTGYHPHEPRQ